MSPFMEGPDAIDQKWTCLFAGCNKRGRKDNMESHVQEHLNHRPYRCLHCKKGFVREYDQKRHSRIHRGVKPYSCPCGTSFTRQDALTRHRQRGTCIGSRSRYHENLKPSLNHKPISPEEGVQIKPLVDGRGDKDIILPPLTGTEYYTSTQPLVDSMEHSSSARFHNNILDHSAGVLTTPLPPETRDYRMNLSSLLT